MSKSATDLRELVSNNIFNILSAAHGHVATNEHRQHSFKNSSHVQKYVRQIYNLSLNRKDKETDRERSGSVLVYTLFVNGKGVKEIFCKMSEASVSVL